MTKSNNGGIMIWGGLDSVLKLVSRTNLSKELK